MIQRFYPGSWGGNDRDGRPIYVLRVGEIDVRGLMKAVHGEDVWIRHVRFDRQTNKQMTKKSNILFPFFFVYDRWSIFANKA